MSTRHTKKLVRENEFIAEVEIDLVESEDAWSPSLSLEDARKLDAVRVALRRSDIAAASRIARVYRLTPLNAAS